MTNSFSPEQMATRLDARIRAMSRSWVPAAPAPTVAARTQLGATTLDIHGIAPRLAEILWHNLSPTLIHAQITTGMVLTGEAGRVVHVDRVDLAGGVQARELAVEFSAPPHYMAPHQLRPSTLIEINRALSLAERAARVAG